MIETNPVLYGFFLCAVAFTLLFIIGICLRWAWKEYGGYEELRNENHTLKARLRDLKQTLSKIENDWRTELSARRVVMDRAEDTANIALGWFENSKPLFNDQSRESVIEELNNLLHVIERPRSRPVAMIEDQRRAS